jgi:uncharacterized membrane protein
MSNQDWSITLTPHRSLSREGFIAIMILIAALNLVAGLMFFVLGAWPIVGFLGLDVLAIWWAFRQNYKDQKEAERIVAEGEELRLYRYLRDDSTSEKTFNRRWLRIELEYDEVRDLVGRLFLRSHGESHEIASFLGAEERASLAKAMRAKL